MTRYNKLLFAKSAVILGTIPVLIYAHDYGPDAGKSGVPGESTCSEQGCHVGTAVNSGPGIVSVQFGGTSQFPGTVYTPGQKQRITVTIKDPNQRRWGFQITARETASNGRTQAGTFQSIDKTTQLMCASANLANQIDSQFGASQGCPANMTLQYMEHTLDGVKNQTGLERYEFDWTPPATSRGNITFYVAGNAANGDTSERGDRIYTKTYTLSPSSAVSNGGSFVSGVTPGGIFTVKASGVSNIADPNGRIWNDSDFKGGKDLPTALDGTSVSVNGKAAYVYYINPNQINAIAPADTTTGTANVIVTNNGKVLDPISTTLGPQSPAFFMYNGTWVVATRNSDGAIIGDPARVPGTVPAKPGDVLILWGTGFGATNPASPDGQLPAGGAVIANAPRITIGGTTATYIGGAISAYAGLYQVAITVPTVNDGDQPVVATVGSVSSPDPVSIYIQK